MAKVCTNEKTASRQRWIENGLLELMQEKRFDTITVTELCRHLELSRRSFYRFFSNMDDVLDSLLNHTFQDMAYPDVDLNIASMQAAYEFWHQQKNLLNALSISGMQGKLTEYTKEYTDENILKQHLSSNDFDTDISLEMSWFVISGLTSLLMIWHSEGFQKTPEQMAQISHRLLSAPILPTR